MHYRNKLWWNECAKKYPHYFSDANLVVVEYGSYNINGSVREHFQTYLKYTGIDWREQDNFVDLVSLAHEVNLGYKCDTVISASLLEHDPYWKASLKNMIDHLNDDGILLLSWGSARNPEHCLTEAPDRQFHNLKASLVLKELDKLGIYVHEFHYEGKLYPNPEVFNNHLQDGMGEVVLLAFKNPALAVGPKKIDSLFPEDK